MPTTETGKSSTESEVSGLDYEETQLTLAPPGGSKSEPEKKRGFSESIDLRLGRPALEAHAKDPASGSSHGPVSGAGKSPASKAQVVGWPPVRSFRRNALRSCTYVKVAVDGTPYLRKVDLDAYAGYQQLLTALEEMLSCFTARDYTNERRLVDPVNGAEYVPTYEDKDGCFCFMQETEVDEKLRNCQFSSKNTSGMRQCQVEPGHNINKRWDVYINCL